VVEELGGEVTRQELQEALGLGNRDHFRKAYLLPALEAGLVEVTVPDNCGGDVPMAFVAHYCAKPACMDAEAEAADQRRSKASLAGSERRLGAKR
jgi:hypothetical protein